MQQRSSPSQTLPILVIGGGMVGIATAIWLQRDGHDVTLIDKGAPEDRASYGNAGVLASASVLPAVMPGIVSKLPKMVLSRKEPLFLRWGYLPRLLPWAMKYLAHANEGDARRIATAMKPIIGTSFEDHMALTEGTSARRHIKPCDFAVLYKDRAAFAQDHLAWDIRRDLGFAWTENAGAERVSYDPAFNNSFDFVAALSGHGQITDPGAYMADLRDHLVSGGAKIIRAEVTDVLHSDGRVTGVMTADGPVAGRSVAITAGAWSPLLTRKLGVRIPVTAESGYHVEFWEPSFMPRRPTLVPGKKLLFSPMQGRLRVAGAVELGGLQNTGREAGFRLIRSALNEMLPGLRYTRETRWFGHRPAPTDSIPVIDAMPGFTGLFLGFGHQHVGLTGSARTGQLLAQLLSGKRPNNDLRPYRVSRFLGRATARVSELTTQTEKGAT